jgi:hypothetical protein
MLTKLLLQQLATDSSYSRGESYYRNSSVRRIKRTDNTFTAKVQGSEMYEVSLTLTTSKPAFDCDCLYDYEGICKHCVALGLAVIDQFGPVVEFVASGGFTPEATDMDSNTLWGQTSTDQKLAFLRQLLDKQADLRAQLFQFAGLNVPVSPTVGAVEAKPVSGQKEADTANNFALIDSISTEIYEALSDLSFDEEALMEEDKYNYYSEELPDPDPIIEPVFSKYIERVSKAMREGRLTDAFTVFLGVYEGSQAATEAENDEMGVIDDYPTITWAIWNAMLGDTYTQLASRVLNPDQIRLALNLLAERAKFFSDAEEARANEDDDESEDDHETPVLYYNLREFQPLLLALVTDVPSAQVMQQAITQHHWQEFGTEYVQLRLAEVLQDPELWLKTADQFADYDQAIGLQLLQRQRQMGNIPMLIQTLHRLSAKFPKVFDDFILDCLDEKLLAPGPDLNLYLTALENRCRRLGQISDYLKLREFWSPTQRSQFIDSLKPTENFSWMANQLFFAQVLHTEGRAEELFNWLKTLRWEYTASLPDILALAAQSHPAECLSLTKKQTGDMLANGKRDRRAYGTIAGWLAALHKIPSLRSPVVLYVALLTGQYSTLRALKDELRMKGLL